MSASVLCSGCGHRWEVEASARRKVRCPECGVYNELSESTRKTAATKRPAPRSADLAVPATPSPVEEQLFRTQGIVTCLRCGEQTRFASGRRKDARQCPGCGSVEGVAWSEQPPPEPAIPGEDEETADPEEIPGLPGSDADDGRPYRVPGVRKIRLCPSCKAELALRAKRCVACGVDVEKAAKTSQEYEPIHRHWETGWSFRTRRALFLTLQALVVPLGLVGAILQGEVSTFVFAWFPFTALLAFVLGTHDHLDLRRDRRGRVFLTKTWYFFFVHQRVRRIDVREYEGVHTAVSLEATIIEWLIFLALLWNFVMPVALYGIRTAVSSETSTTNWLILLGMSATLVVPVGLYWYYGIQALSYTVALMQGHGYPELILYRGGREAQMEDIAATLRDAYAFPYEQDYGRSANTPRDRP